MFTGIIEALGAVRQKEELPGLARLRIQAPFASELTVGQSVSHNGVCLTVEKILPGEYTVAVIQESLDRTSLKSLQEGARVNLERCLPANGRLDGHVVQGHVDCTGVIEDVREEPGQVRFSIKAPAVHSALVVEKGSIAVDGISLTVAATTPDQNQLVFDVCLIPHTLAVTNAAMWKKQGLVNLEFDILGKYVKKWMELRPSASFPGT